MKLNFNKDVKIKNISISKVSEEDIFEEDDDIL